MTHFSRVRHRYRHFSRAVPDVSRPDAG